MCGICGVIGSKQPESLEPIARRMMAALRHRGPDDEGLVVALPVVLGMRRLSIIDLAGGHQPVFNEDGSVAVVFNGEIYNFQELRHALEGAGHVFRTHSDTEAIVHAYEEWGVDCVEHLRGMFAFAIVETSKNETAGGQRVFLARDRFGIKPLYYAFVDGALLFASEVRALLAVGQTAPRLSVDALFGYLLFGSVGEPMTMVEGVLSLPPGHRMLIPVGRPARGLEPEAYWDFAEVPKVGAPDRGRAAKRLRSLLEETVREHLIADVPLGVFLSSGIDSTALAALASRERRDLLTFTVAFSEQEFSEAELARRTAKKFGTSHQELLLSGEEMLARLDEAVAAMDQPSIDGINTYFVSWAARQVGLKVALSGLGSDEAFGGYPTFRLTPRLERVSALAHSVPGGLRSIGSLALAEIEKRLKPGDAARKLASLWSDPEGLPHPYFFSRVVLTPAQVLGLLDGAYRPAGPPLWLTWLTEASRKAERLDGFASTSYLEARSYMVNTLLRDTDSMSMAHSLEVRVPFLDHHLWEFVAEQPESIKRRRGTPKALLVDALEDLLPREVVFQRKRTFTFPWERWLRGPLRKRVEEGLAELAPSLRPVLSEQGVRAMWHSYLEGHTSWSRPWSLYVLNEWARRHLAAC